MHFLKTYSTKKHNRVCACLNTSDQKRELRNLKINQKEENTEMETVFSSCGIRRGISVSQVLNPLSTVWLESLRQTHHSVFFHSTNVCANLSARVCTAVLQRGWTSKVGLKTFVWPSEDVLRFLLLQRCGRSRTWSLSAAHSQPRGQKLQPLEHTDPQIIIHEISSCEAACRWDTWKCAEVDGIRDFQKLFYQIAVKENRSWGSLFQGIGTRVRELWSFYSGQTLLGHYNNKCL